MTLDELQAAGKRDKWSSKPEFEGRAENWDAWLVKSRLRIAIEVANAKGLSVEVLAKELMDELGK